MDTQRKLQLGAMLVIANGLVALGATPALAAACSDNNTVFLCDSCASSCPLVSGCTATKICPTILCAGRFSTVCSYS